MSKGIERALDMVLNHLRANVDAYVRTLATADYNVSSIRQYFFGSHYKGYQPPLIMVDVDSSPMIGLGNAKQHDDKAFVIIMCEGRTEEDLTRQCLRYAMAVEDLLHLEILNDTDIGFTLLVTNTLYSPSYIPDGDERRPFRKDCKIEFTIKRNEPLKVF
jgi:hypothetical protein